MNWSAEVYTLVWVDHVDGERECVRELDEWVEAQSPIVRAQTKASIKFLMKRAAAGELWEATDKSVVIKPILYDPDIYELRYKAMTTAMRFYHGEPDGNPLELWKLNRHIKTSGAQQQREIEHAADRYRGVLEDDDSHQ